MDTMILIDEYSQNEIVCLALGYYPVLEINDEIVVEDNRYIIVKREFNFDRNIIFCYCKIMENIV